MNQDKPDQAREAAREAGELEPEQKPAPTDQKDPVSRAAASLRASLPRTLLLQQLRPSGKPWPYDPRGPTLSETRAATRRKAIRDITSIRFQYPNERYRDYKTYTNVPDRSMGVAMPDGSVAYPDIVVVQDPENYCKILGEVETAETVTEQVALRRWKPYAELAPLYLYVPVGQGDHAHRLAKRLQVPIVGLRTWRYAVGVEEIEINDYFTVASGPEEMLPRILRPR